MGRSLFAIGSSVTAAVLAACGGPTDGAGARATDSARDPPFGVRDPKSLPMGGREVVSAATRVAPNRGVVLRRLRLRAVYIGGPDDGASNFDAFLQRVAESGYFGQLAEYGVDLGELAGSSHVPTASFFPATRVVDGTVEAATFEELARSYMPRSMQGADLPRQGPAAALAFDAEAFIFFLPRGVDVTLAKRGTYTYRTCVDVLGYHAFNGLEPFVVIGSCARSRSSFIVSHEIAEVATDPVVGSGWMSVEHASRSGGEIADLCKAHGAVTVEGWSVARLWSNARGACAPP